MTKRSMLLLASEQPMPSLLAACAGQFGIDAVCLLTTTQMADVANRLSSVFHRRNLNVRIEQVEDAFDPRATEAAVVRVVGSEPEGWIVNVTGGTKIMSIGAAIAARDVGVRDIVYLDHVAGEAHWLFSERPATSVSARLGLAEVLEAHGWSSKVGARPSIREVKLAARIFELMQGHVRQAWNGWMEIVRRKCEGSRASWRPQPVSLNGEALGCLGNADRQRALMGARAIAHAAAETGLVTLADGGIRVPDRRTHRFLAGDWLVAALWDVLRRNRQILALDHCVAHAEVRSAKGAEAEIDILALQGSRLIVLEAKTVRLTGRGVVENRPAAIADRLTFLNRMGGLKTLPLLVSLDHLMEAQRPRFREAGITVIDGLTATSLEDRLVAAVRQAA